jgi:L-threonylcarbamoyladenylate synthase
MMPTVLPWNDPAAAFQVLTALETGKTLIFPTDTVFGLGGNPWDERVLERVSALKQRDPKQPFTLHLSDVETVARYANVAPRIRPWVERLLPGPYTVLLPALARAPRSAVQDGVVGVRVPDHPFFLHVMRDLDRPVFGTSVNRHGEPPMSDPIAIIDAFSSVDLVITGRVGNRPSAIVDLTSDPPRCVRGTAPSDLCS